VDSENATGDQYGSRRNLLQLPLFYESRVELGRERQKQERATIYG